MTYTLIPNIWYTITPETDCDIDTPNGISIHLPAGIQYFPFADSVSIDISGTATVTQNPPLFKPASAAVSGGGYIESNLNVGHGAADAVAAVCTLAPGADLDIGGTLEHDGSVVELEDQFAELDIAVSHPEYGGKLEVTDTGGQTLYTFGIPAVPGDFASILLTLSESTPTGQIEFGLDKGDGTELDVYYPFEGDFSLDDFMDFLNSCAEGSLGDFAEASTAGGAIRITLKDPAFAGVTGNAVKYVYMAMSPFTNEDGEAFSGGENARDLAGLVEAMQDDDAPVTVEANSNNDGVLLTSKVGGAAGAYNVVNVAGSGDLWLGVNDTLAIATPRTLADLAGYITIHAELMELASASVSDEAIMLTAPTTPTARQYNDLEYTATGCFGGGTVKQGSATRGKNAVEQTDFEIILNGNQPRPLTPTTTMRNGGVYTVEADIDARNVTLAEHATATIVVSAADGLVPNVQLPAWKWCTENGLQPALAYFHVYRLKVADDGFLTTARLVSSYSLASEWLYTQTGWNSYLTNQDLHYIADETNKLAGSTAPWNVFRRDSDGGPATHFDGSYLDMSDNELPSPAVTRGDVTFHLRFAIEIKPAKKFKAVVFSMMGYGASGIGSVLFQAWTGEEWVDAADVMTVEVKKGQARKYAVHIYDDAPQTDKWRVFFSETYLQFGGFHFFEA